MAESTDPTRVSVVNALVVVIAVVPLVAIYLFFAAQLDVMPFAFIGFTFILYWTGIKHAAPAEFLPALAGSLGGLLTAYLVGVLPATFGTAGVVLIAIMIGGAIFLLVRGQFHFLVNNAFMLFLTLGTSLAFKTQDHFQAGAVAVLIAAIYTGALMLIAKAISSRTRKPVNVEATNI